MPVGVFVSSWRVVCVQLHVRPVMVYIKSLALQATFRKCGDRRLARRTQCQSREARITQSESGFIYI